jgi:hypothetical protein
MTQSRAIIDSVTHSEGSTRKKTRRGYEWHDVAGQLHRVDGPALEWPDGSTSWYLHGQIHREDGPAQEWPDGSKQWWVHDRQHRTDGPAVEVAHGNKKWWYVNGRQFTEDEFNMYVDQTTGEVFLPPGKKLTHDYR